MEFRKNGRGHGKVMEFSFFGPNISGCLETRNILLVREQKIYPKKAGFSAFLSHGKLKLVMEKSLNFIAQFLYEPCYIHLKGFYQVFRMFNDVFNNSD